MVLADEVAANGLPPIWLAESTRLPNPVPFDELLCAKNPTIERVPSHLPSDESESAELPDLKSPFGVVRLDEPFPKEIETWDAPIPSDASDGTCARKPSSSNLVGCPTPDFRSAALIGHSPQDALLPVLVPVVRFRNERQLFTSVSSLRMNVRPKVLSAWKERVHPANRVLQEDTKRNAPSSGNVDDPNGEDPNPASCSLVSRRRRSPKPPGSGAQARNGSRAHPRGTRPDRSNWSSRRRSRFFGGGSRA